MTIHMPGEATSHSTGDAADGAAPDTLVTYYQPFYNLRTGRLQGLEALARVRTGDEGDVAAPPGFSAPSPGDDGMRELDLRVLDDALAHKMELAKTSDHRQLIVSVNLSWDLIAHPRFVKDVRRSLARHHVPGDRLLVDLSAALFRRLHSADDGERARLTALQCVEIAFCLDGFTADDLDLLPSAAAMPVDIIKLHPRLVSTGDRQALADIAGAVQDVGLPVVAAGVETREQLELVRELGFEWAQGFLLGEPADARTPVAAQISDLVD